jgi:hypothetical protein
MMDRKFRKKASHLAGEKTLGVDHGGEEKGERWSVKEEND